MMGQDVADETVHLEPGKNNSLSRKLGVGFGHHITKFNCFLKKVDIYGLIV
jgi:hypothetical protein